MRRYSVTLMRTPLPGGAWLLTVTDRAPAAEEVERYWAFVSIDHARRYLAELADKPRIRMAVVQPGYLTYSYGESIRM